MSLTVEQYRKSVAEMEQEQRRWDMAEDENIVSRAILVDNEVTRGDVDGLRLYLVRGRKFDLQNDRYLLFTDLVLPGGRTRQLRNIGSVTVRRYEGKVPYVCNSYLDPDFRSKGIGTWMYKAVINDVGLLRSDVSRSSSANRLWDRLRGSNPTCVAIVVADEDLQAEPGDLAFEARSPVHRRDVRVRRHERRVR